MQVEEEAVSSKANSLPAYFQTNCASQDAAHAKAEVRVEALLWSLLHLWGRQKTEASGSQLEMKDKEDI